MGKNDRRSTKLVSPRSSEQWIYLGSEYDRWHMLKMKSGATSDIELLTMLVDSYIKFHMKDSELLQGAICPPVTSDHLQTSTGSTEEKAKFADANQQTEIKMERDSDTESPTDIRTDVNFDTSARVVESGKDSHKDNTVNTNNQRATNTSVCVNTIYQTGKNIGSCVNINNWTGIDNGSGVNTDNYTRTKFGSGENTGSYTGTKFGSQACTFVSHTEASVVVNHRKMNTQTFTSESPLDSNEVSNHGRVNVNSEKQDFWTGAFVDFHQISRKTSMEAEIVNNNHNVGASAIESWKSNQDGRPREEFPTVMMCGEELITIKVEKDNETENQSEQRNEATLNTPQSGDITPRQSVVIKKDEGSDILIDTVMCPQNPLDGSSVTSEKAMPSNKSNTGNTHTNFDDVEKMEFECNICFKSFSTKSSLKRHVKTHLDNEIFKCKECKVILDSSEAMRAHMKTDHSQIYLCSECGKECGTKTNLNKHMRIKHGDTLVGLQKPITCPIDGCGQSFVHKTKYGDHLLNHSAIKPHSCEICSKSFSSRYSRNLCQKKCTGKMVIECDICKIAFSNPTTLGCHREAQHLLTHYSCICGKKFKYRSNLARHKKLHTFHK